MLSNNALVALVLGSFTSAVTAQSVKVAPIDHANPNEPPAWIAGDTSTSRYPFSYGISRVMYVYESSASGRTLLDIPDNAPITALGFPRDEGSSSSGVGVRLQVFMGASAKTAATADADFAQNFSGQPVEVFTLKIFNLPNLGQGNEVVWVPLDTPFPFDASENLAVDYRVHANANSNQSFTYRLDRGRAITEVSSFGQGCQASGGQSPQLTSNGTAIGETWRPRLSRGPANASAYLNIGVSRLAAPIGIPGAPGCDALVAPNATLSGTTSGSGTESWSVSVPNDVDLWEATVYSQAIAIDFFANPAGLVVSDGDAMTIGLDPRMSIIRANGSATATRGSVTRNFGQVSLFRHN